MDKGKVRDANDQTIFTVPTGVRDINHPRDAAGNPIVHPDVKLYAERPDGAVNIVCIFSQKGRLVKCVWRIFQRSLLVPNLLFLLFYFGGNWVLSV